LLYLCLVVECLLVILQETIVTMSCFVIIPKLLLLHLRLVTKLLLTLKLRLLVLRLLVRPRLLLKVHLIVVRLDGEPAKMLVMFLLRDHARHEGKAGVEVELFQ
jgi:hypothetical protein